METYPNPKEKLMTALEVSRYLRVPLSTIYELAAKGKLRAVKFGRHWRFVEDDLKTNGNKPDSEKREFARLNVEIPARLQGMLTHTRNIQIEGLIRNISEEGIFFVPFHTDFNSGDPIQIQFVLPRSGTEPLTLDGRIVHLTHSKSGLGIKLKQLSRESREALRIYVG